MISRAVIDEIHHRADIVETISTYVTLKRAGSNFGGLCPFHSEKTPSFTVFPATRSFYCFGCGAGGDVITFIMKAENLDYPSAIELLGKRVGIDIVRDEKEDGALMKRKRVFEMNLEAAKFFRECLFDKTLGEPGMEYFNSRGLSSAIIKRFGLGYAPQDFGMLTRHMRSKGFSEEELISGFLCGKSQKTGKPYDYFRGRVIFPIIDTAGNVIAFGGRVLDDSKPKYLNSSDTPGFKKSRNLFALNYAKDHCSEQLILCEGYMDVIALHAAGFANSVATLGTALTGEQARIMSKYTKKVIISYDADEAGQKAAMRAIKLLSDVGIDVTILKVPGAKDPDEYIKSFGADKFKTLLSESKSKFDYNFEAILSRYNLSSSNDKIKALGESEKLISEVYSSAERDIYIKAVAEKFEVDPRSVKLDVDKFIRKGNALKKKEESNRIKQEAIGYTDKVNPDFIKAPAVAKKEEAVLGLLLLYPEHRKRVFDNDILGSDDFYTELNRRIFEYLRRAYFEFGDSHTDINEAFSDDEVGRITRMKIGRMSLSENGNAVLDEAIETLKKSLSKKMATQNTSFEDLNKILERKNKEVQK